MTANIMKDYYPPLAENQFYHVFNRGNNREHIFYSPRNYGYFLRKYDEYLSDYLATYAYCLLPNHFHFLVRVKENHAIDDLSHLVSEQFRRFFIGYSQQLINKKSEQAAFFKKVLKEFILILRNICSIWFITSTPIHKTTT